jgi:hypothetical protein
MYFSWIALAEHSLVNQVFPADQIKGKRTSNLLGDQYMYWFMHPVARAQLPLVAILVKQWT